MKKVLLAIFLSFTIASISQAQGLKEKSQKLEQNIYDIQYAGMNIDSIDNDMYLYLGWQNKDKKKWKQTAAKSIKKLDQIKKYLLKIDLEPSMDKIRNALILSVEGYKKIYDEIENKNTDAVNKEYASLYEGPIKDYNDKLRVKFTAIIDPDSLSKQLFKEDFNLNKIQADTIKNPYDRQEYLKACELIEGHKFKAAHDIIKILNDKYKGDSTQYPILLRMADCVAAYDSDIKKDDTSRTDPLEAYSIIINSNEYSPVLEDAFIKWRTEYQSKNYGDSNFSEIPNDLYNKKRWGLVKLIQRHLNKNPLDLWAKWQILALMDIPNIHRGGLFGNTNINHASALFGNENEQ